MHGCRAGPRAGRAPAAVAIVKAWIEGDPPSNLRIHVHAASLDGGGETDLGTTADIGEACMLVGTWLTGFAADNGGARLGLVGRRGPGATGSRS